MKKRQGFTLIELLIVVSIIAVIASIGLVTYTNAQRSARDGRRKDDLKQIATALELYQQQNGSFPPGYFTTGSVFESFSNYGPTPWIYGLTSSYINALPVDPLNNANYDYVYTALTTNFVLTPYFCSAVSRSGNKSCCFPNAYALVAKMENSQDSNAPVTIPANHCGDNTPAGNSSSPFYVVWGK